MKTERSPCYGIRNHIEIIIDGELFYKNGRFIILFEGEYTISALKTIVVYLLRKSQDITLTTSNDHNAAPVNFLLKLKTFFYVLLTHICPIR